jgi:hypothetical protein
MKEKKSSWLRNLILGLFLLAAGILLMLFVEAPPLVPSSAYTVTYSVNGHKYNDGKVYRAFNFDSKSYAFLPQVDGLYRFIGIDRSSQRAFVPGIFSEPFFGWNCIHRDVRGCNLNNPKLEGGWKIVFHSDGVDLSSQWLTWQSTPQLLTVRLSDN